MKLFEGFVTEDVNRVLKEALRNSEKISDNGIKKIDEMKLKVEGLSLSKDCGIWSDGHNVIIKLGRNKAHSITRDQRTFEKFFKKKARKELEDVSVFKLFTIDSVVYIVNGNFSKGVDKFFNMIEKLRLDE